MASSNSNTKTGAVGRFIATLASSELDAPTLRDRRADEPVEGPFSECDARRHARVPLGVPAEGSSDAHEVSGVLQNLSMGGGLLVIPGSVTPPTGTGVEISFRLPTGPQLRLPSTIRWVRADEPRGHSSSGIQFVQLTGANRSYLEHFVELVASHGSEPHVRTQVTSKYRVSFDTGGRVHAMLGGILTRDEAQSFAVLLKQRIAARRMARMQFAFDVRRLSVCSAEVINELKQCFEYFAQRPEVFGFLIGCKSLALTQLVRAAREAGIADNVVCVDEPEHALRIWDQLEG